MIVQKFSGLDSINLFNTYGGTNNISGNVKFQQDVKNVLETPLGSILGNLNFGSNLYKMIFLPVNNALGTMIQEEVRKRIESNFKDVIVESVDVTFDKTLVTVNIGINNNNSNILEYISIDLEKEE